MNIKNGLVSCSLLLVFLISSVLLFGILSAPNFFNNATFAQKTVAPFDSSVLRANNTTVHFNTYENNQIGVSLKYPSNFLIDESKSNNTLRQISFYPVNNVNLSFEKYILWMDIFVQTLNPAQSLSSHTSSLNSSTLPSQSNTDIGNYIKNLVNSIQQRNKDVTVIESSANKSLSGYPAYKLVTKSYFNNTPIDDVEIGTIVNNKLYSLNYQTESSNYLNSIPTANKIIQSFKIISPVPLPASAGASAAALRRNRITTITIT